MYVKRQSVTYFEMTKIEIKNQSVGAYAYGG